MRLPQPMNLGQIAALIGGRVHGDPTVEVSTVCPSPMQAKEDDLAFVFDQKLVKKLGNCVAKAIVAKEGTEKDFPERNMVLVPRPNLAIQKVLTAVAPKRYYPPAGVHPTAVVDESAVLGANVALGPYVVVGPKSKIGAGTKIMAHTVIGGEVEIGENCIIYPHCIVADYCKIGNRVIMQQGASLGSDGFGYVTERPSNLEQKMAGQKEFSDAPNPLLKIPQIGNVVLHDDVEIGAYATIDRATMGSTIVGEGTKIDNLVMIAHNNRIGKENLIIACVAVGGSCVLGDRVVIGGGSNVSDHLTLSDDAVLSGGSGAMKDIPPGEIHVGTPAVASRDFFSQIANSRRMPRLIDDLKDLKKRMAILEEQIAEKALATTSKNG
ncbi:MAG: UDP-3-O-(3-hydroxymyristoyl)glucosamine N-acyltransferase [Cyanobacteria bacterium SZAS LIN-3]|nr:UDP-3-O-(3-hydroxymyristoyl)glucosamine N-acyltransferase [Cyanobacteria bacterium SZAS LIN-3]MBS2006286.1 UDP-3-O-(3-hydroxymyristoyl)glucosamine N-acyltransferase [Cyanobacteria bacterium SZAS TMP-1]